MLTRNRIFEKNTGQIFNAQLLKFESRVLKKPQKKGVFGDPQKRPKKGVFGGGQKWPFLVIFGNTRFVGVPSIGGWGGTNSDETGGGVPPENRSILNSPDPHFGGGSKTPPFWDPHFGTPFWGFNIWENLYRIWITCDANMNFIFNSKGDTKQKSSKV